MTSPAFDEVAFADNPEPRCPCVLLIDVSESMLGPPLVPLQTGLAHLRRDLMQDPLAQRRVELAIITFGERIERVVDFTTPERLTTPMLTARGETPMGAAIGEALESLRMRKDDYRRNGIAYFRPWLFMLTDGVPTDDWRGAAERIREGEKGGAFSFFAVAIAPANRAVLDQMGTRPSLALDGLRFGDLFQWLSSSLSQRPPA